MEMAVRAPQAALGYIIVRHVYLRLKIKWERYILYDVYVYNISIDRFIGLYAYICVYVYT